MNTQTPVLKTLVALSFFLASSSAFASSCGTGQVTELIEGGGNSSDLIIGVSGAPDTQVSDTLWENKYIRFRANEMDVERMRAIRSLAYLAFTGGYGVNITSHHDDCTRATEISVK